MLNQINNDIILFLLNFLDIKTRLNLTLINKYYYIFNRKILNDIQSYDIDIELKDVIYMPYNIYSLFFSYNIFNFKIIIDGNEEFKNLNLLNNSFCYTSKYLSIQINKINSNNFDLIIYKKLNFRIKLESNKHKILNIRGLNIFKSKNKYYVSSINKLIKFSIKRLR